MMTEIKSILYATDLGKNSVQAFRMAASLAVHHKAKMVIIHVVEPVPARIEMEMRQLMGNDASLEKLRQERNAELHASINERLEKFCSEEMPAGTSLPYGKPEFRIVEGRPTKSILKAADQIDADLLVLGRHNHNTLDELIVGSVGNKVMHLSPRPVLLVPVQ